MKFKIVFIVFYLMLALPVQGQEQRQIDSLFSVLKTVKEDTNKLNTYIKLFTDFYPTKEIHKYHESSVQLAEILIRNATNKKLKNILLRKKAYCYNEISQYFWMNEDTIKQQQFSDKTLAIYQQLKDTTAIVNLYLSQVFQNYNGKSYAKAISFYHKAVDLAKASNNNFRLARCNEQFAMMYMQAMDYKTPIPYLEEANKAYILAKDTSHIEWTYFHLAKCYSLSHDLRNAIKYYRLDSAIQNKRGIKYNGYMSLSIIYQQNKDFNNAVIYAKKALNEDMKAPEMDSVFLSMYYSQIGDIYKEMQQYDSSIVYYQKAFSLNRSYTNNLAQIYFLKKDYVSAKKYFNDNGFNELLAYQLDSLFGNYKGALVHHLKYLKGKEETNRAELLTQANQLKFQQAFDKQQEEQVQKDLIANKEKQQQQIILWFVLGGLSLVIVFAIMMYNRFKVTQKQKTIIEVKEKETQQQNIVISQQKHLVEEKQKEITDSINYAQRLQQAILPPTEFITENFPNSFVLYKPKDIVAGDFYWAEQINNLFFIAAADCTGHGVPGAMVSVVCSNALNRTVKEFALIDTGKILDKTRELVIETFEKSNAEIKDGMDISLLCIDKKNQKLYWSGAHNALWYVQDNILTEIKADKQPVGKSYDAKPFTTNNIGYKTDTTFYLFTDGFADQFGGPKGKKFKYKQFEETLVSINKQPMTEQAKTIDNKFEEWKGSLEQVDDVCVIGIKI